MTRPIVFRTNVDRYKGANTFPKLMDVIPRIGETVEVTYKPEFINRGLPTRMQVVDVTYTEFEVVVELWFKAIDIKAAEISGVNLFQ